MNSFLKVGFVSLSTFVFFSCGEISTSQNSSGSSQSAVASRVPSPKPEINAWNGLMGCAEYSQTLPPSQQRQNDKGTALVSSLCGPAINVQRQRGGSFGLTLSGSITSSSANIPAIPVNIAQQFSLAPGAESESVTPVAPANVYAVKLFFKAPFTTDASETPLLKVAIGTNNPDTVFVYQDVALSSL